MNLDLVLVRVIIGIFAGAALGKADLIDTSTWRSHLPWGDLQASLKNPASLIDTSPATFVAECIPEFEEITDRRTNWKLIDQPGGLCTDFLFCGFKNCDPILGDDKPSTALVQSSPNVAQVFSELPQNYKDAVSDTSNPLFNVASKVLHPIVATDVIKAVNFAKEHSLDISIKNSGHSYSHSSTKANTLLLNMRRYEEDLLNIQTCASNADDAGVADDGADLSGQPCRLARDRGKSGVIRVSGGRNWGEVLQAVNKYNGDSPAFLVIAGAAATVSPMGWSFQGGLGSTAAGRMYGFGADQILQIEMVLASGKHVKFGPTKWESSEGYGVPKTTEVSGVCNTKASEGGERWETCDTNIPFFGLWKAMRGGGGGYGVVLSVYLQLHPYAVLETVGVGTRGGYTCGSGFSISGLPTEQQNALLDTGHKFNLLYFLDSENSLGINKTVSNRCGAPPPGLLREVYCYGEGSGRSYLEAYKAYFNSQQTMLLETGLTPEQIQQAIDCNNIDDDPSGSSWTFVDFYEKLIALSTLPDGPNGLPLPADLPCPTFPNALSAETMINVVIPTKWILENIDKAAQQFPPNYMAFGGAVSTQSDQANAVPKCYREGGNMRFIAFPKMGAFYNESFYDMFISDPSDKSNFPSFIGSNHYGVDHKGPLRNDWTQTCPTDWTRLKRDEECISAQEAVWGTELLHELEEIKHDVDPTGMFDCNLCIADGKRKASEVPSISSGMGCLVNIQLIFVAVGMGFLLMM